MFYRNVNTTHRLYYTLFIIKMQYLCKTKKVKIFSQACQPYKFLIHYIYRMHSEVDYEQTHSGLPYFTVSG